MKYILLITIFILQGCGGYSLNDFKGEYLCEDHEGLREGYYYNYTVVCNDGSIIVNINTNPRYFNKPTK